ncbi:MAG: hypothetical protein AAB706_01570 [Patescibacteria group bacterium]
MIAKEKIEAKLRKFLRRNPTPDEIINGAGDQNIVNEILLEEINRLSVEVETLKKK